MDKQLLRKEIRPAGGKGSGGGRSSRRELPDTALTDQAVLRLLTTELSEPEYLGLGAELPEVELCAYLQGETLSVCRLRNRRPMLQDDLIDPLTMPVAAVARWLYMNPTLRPLVRIPTDDLDVSLSISLTISCSAWFADPQFQQWLKTTQTPPMMWHTPLGNPADYSEIVVFVDPACDGRGSDSDMPAHIWDCIVNTCRSDPRSRAVKTPIVVRLQNGL